MRQNAADFLNYLARREPRLGSAEFGKSLEHYILMELKAYQAYRQPELARIFGAGPRGLRSRFAGSR